MATSSRAAIGFSVHTGWAVAVVVGRDAAGKPTLLAKARLELADENEKARFVFHVAGGHPIPGTDLVRRDVTVADAQRVVDAAVAVVDKRTRAALSAFLLPLSSSHTIAFAAVVPKVAPALADVIKSHAKAHAAEAALYTRAIEDACAAGGVKVVHPKRSVSDPRFTPKPPSPWTKDHKMAAAWAWAVLTANRERAKPR